jgi:anaerobic ribonucleoside-triphosphate reductase
MKSVSSKIFKKEKEALKNGTCHDCGKKLTINDGQIEDGALLIYEDGEEKIAILKCDKCYKEDPSLQNYKKCEVYSRIVGYLRPVQDWNNGKTQEYSERATFTI